MTKITIIFMISMILTIPGCGLEEKHNNRIEFYNKTLCKKHGGTIAYGGAQGLPVEKLVFCADGAVLWDGAPKTSNK